MAKKAQPAKKAAVKAKRRGPGRPEGPTWRPTKGIEVRKSWKFGRANQEFEGKVGSGRLLIYSRDVPHSLMLERLEKLIKTEDASLMRLLKKA